MMVSMMARRPVPLLACMPMRTFAQPGKYIGENDMIRQLRKQKRKYGMKHHFYDREQLDKMTLPDKQ